ncbi:MAG: choice-of-anchor L domain-containing protein, partial [Pelagibacterales bacterium]|nr:choice-of-anchor L domain-containing protein [Pelagibacterales bacterium]
MRFIVNILFFLIFSINFIYSQDNQPPVISSEGNETYCPLTQQNITTSFNIADPDDTTLDALYIQISTGYVSGEDQLILTGTHPNISTSWDTLEGKLEITGPTGNPANISDIIVAVNDVVFFSSNPTPSSKTFSFTIGDANYLPSTDHYYVYVESLNITWTDARDQAETMTYYGLQGYLATILSEDENQISAEQITGVGWIGASDEGVEGTWNWVTGPEVGTNFWNGDMTGSPVTGMYANWNNNEPNDCCNDAVGSEENYAHITDNSVGIVGSWNDLPNVTNTSGAYQAKGFIVEYGGTPGDPELNLSSSTSLIAPNITIEEFVGCNNEFTGLTATSINNDVYWYDNETGGNLVYTGNVYNPNISTTTTYWVTPFSEGECDSFSRIPITATITPGPTPITPNVTVDQCTYTIEELVTDVLISNSCASVSNITYSTGTNFNDVNGIGYFSEPSGGFTFSEGIILSSGDATFGTGPNNGGSGQGEGGGGWPGDDDLTSLLTNPSDGTNNASIIEFDFVPISNQLSFRFIMASEEYDQGSWECTYSDVFGFFLTDQNGVTTNLAVLPDTDIPIAITNIHPENSVCEAANPQYFHSYTPAGQPDIEYDGRTRAFTAEADVNIGETYHIKLAVADAIDTILDSAVFLEAGSFDLGINLGDDILVPTGLSPCDGGIYTIDTQIDSSVEEASYIWYKDGIEIAGEVESTLTVAEPGQYSVDVELSEECISNDDIIIEFYVPQTVESLPALDSCDNLENDGDAIFDLTQQTPNIIAQLTLSEYTIGYFETQENAENNTNPIISIDAYDNIVPFSQTIYARIVENFYPDCYSIATFQLNSFNPPEVIVPTALQECDDDYNGITSFNLT